MTLIAVMGLMAALSVAVIWLLNQPALPSRGARRRLHPPSKRDLP